MFDLTHFQKPQRYIGNEHNVIRKSHEGKVSICLCYPEPYEIGMSNLGLRILYGLLNSFDNIVCERAFMPAPDFYRYLRQNSVPVSSLETATALGSFQVLAFNLNYELTYTNFLAMLAAGGIEVWAQKRKDSIVLGGAVANPEVLSDFVDVFFMGEFEGAAAAFVDIVRTCRSKDERLKALAATAGFYVPRFYECTRRHDTYECRPLLPQALLPVRKQHVQDLDRVYTPDSWLVPHTEIIHDRLQVEIARGCPNRCSFCQARCAYFPYRERNPERVLEIIQATYEKSGYENLSLLSLSASNYSRIEELIGTVFDYCQRNVIGVSLPSLRVEDVLTRLYPVLRKIKKVSATFAIEAATERLRDSVHKKVDMAALMEAARMLKSLGSRHIKLYFMFGFPEETEEDLIAIGGFVRTLKSRVRLNINVSINALVPKPFSSLEGFPVARADELDAKRALILKYMPHERGIKLSISDVRKSRLEALLARADRQFSSVLFKAFERGACFDAHTELFNWDAWEQVFRESGFDQDEYLLRRTDNFPWSHITVK